MIKLFIASALVCGYSPSQYVTHGCLSDQVSKPFATEAECAQAGLKYLGLVQQLNLEKGLKLEVRELECREYVVPDYIDDEQL